MKLIIVICVLISCAIAHHLLDKDGKEIPHDHDNEHHHHADDHAKVLNGTEAHHHHDHDHDHDHSHDTKPVIGTEPIHDPDFVNSTSFIEKVEKVDLEPVSIDGIPH